MGKNDGESKVLLNHLSIWKVIKLFFSIISLKIKEYEYDSFF